MPKPKSKFNSSRFGWRYGIIRKTKRLPNGKIYRYYDIHEIYSLRRNGELSYTQDPVSVNGSETLEDLRWSLAMMMADSYRMPVYEIVKGKLVERTKRK